MSSRKGKDVARDPRYGEYDHQPGEAMYTADYFASGSLAPPQAGGTSAGYEYNTMPTGNQPVRKSKTIKSDGQVALQGPLDVVGSVKSGSNISLEGDFTVREKIEAYGGIDVNGHLTCK